MPHCIPLCAFFFSSQSLEHCTPENQTVLRSVVLFPSIKFILMENSLSCKWYFYDEILPEAGVVQIINLSQEMLRKSFSWVILQAALLTRWHVRVERRGRQPTAPAPPCSRCFRRTSLFAALSRGVWLKPFCSALFFVSGRALGCAAALCCPREPPDCSWGSGVWREIEVLSTGVQLVSPHRLVWK